MSPAGRGLTIASAPRVYSLYRHHPQRGRRSDRYGGEGIAIVCDMANDGQIRSLFEQVRRQSGHLNILVNNAAFPHEGMQILFPKGPFLEQKYSPLKSTDPL